MDLRSLSYLCAIVETGGFANAALKVKLSQPALSKAVAQLEEECGLQLLFRGKRGTKVALTPAGEMVFARGRKMLEERQLLLADLGAVLKSNAP